MPANYIIIPVISLRRSEKISNTLADRNYSKLNKKLEFKVFHMISTKEPKLSIKRFHSDIDVDKMANGII